MTRRQELNGLAGTVVSVGGSSLGQNVGKWCSCSSCVLNEFVSALQDKTDQFGRVYVNIASQNKEPHVIKVLPERLQRESEESDGIPSWMPRGREPTDPLGASFWSSSGIRTGFPGTADEKLSWNWMNIITESSHILELYSKNTHNISESLVSGRFASLGFACVWGFGIMKATREGLRFTLHRVASGVTYKQSMMMYRDVRINKYIMYCLKIQTARFTVRFNRTLSILKHLPVKEKQWQSQPELREKYKELSKVSHRSYIRTVSWQVM